MELTTFAEIKKGKHYSGFQIPDFYINNDKNLSIEHRLVFTNECRYDLQTPDQSDINKLFGIGYLPSHHTKSCRFGWRYDIAKDKIEIMSYWYEKGIRYFEHLCWVEIGEVAIYLLLATEDRHHLIVNASSGTFSKTLTFGRSAIGWKLKPYFGGNRTAPHTMKILEQK